MDRDIGAMIVYIALVTEDRSAKNATVSMPELFTHSI